MISSFQKNSQICKFCCKYGPKNVPKTFHILADTIIDGKHTPCMIQHKTLPIYGVLFHPELRKNTHCIIHDFLAKT